MLGKTPLILLIVPLFFQLVFGTIAILKPTFVKFKTVFITNIFLQIVLSIASYYIAIHNFSKHFEQYPTSNRCGMPFVGLITLFLFCCLALFAVIIIQFWIKKAMDKKSNPKYGN